MSAYPFSYIKCRVILSYALAIERKRMDNPTTNQTTHQAEDNALKVMHDYFANVLLPYWEIPGEVDHIAPTENVYLEMRKQFQDINIVMKDGSLIHFEFQSTHNTALENLRRFRAYEAVLCLKYKTDVYTYVLFSGGIQQPMTEFTCGVNTYRVQPIIMAGKNAEDVFNDIATKLESGISLTERDLVPLTMCPLMGGSLSQKDRFHKAFEIVRNSGDSIPNLNIIEAVLYTMATKFLSNSEFSKLKEEIQMTELGQMIFNDGIEKAEKESAQNLFKNGVPYDLVRKCIKNISDEDLLKLYNEVTQNVSCAKNNIIA